MRRNRGNLLGILMLLCTVTSAAMAESAYRWSMSQSKTEAVEREAVMLEFVCRFEDEGYEYVIAFDPPMRTQQYRMERLSETEQIEEGRRINTYRFVLFPTVSGRLTLAFEAAMEKSSKAAIEQMVIGRDNVEEFSYVSKTVQLPRADILVSPTGERFAGTFDLKVDVAERRVKAFEPVQVTVTLEGVGNFDDYEGFDLNLSGVRTFTGGIERELRLGDAGFAGIVRQQFALVSDNNFTLPPLQFRYFDVAQRRTNVLRHQATPIEVVRLVPRLEPLDVPAEEPMDAATDWGWVHLLLALLTGIAIGRFLLPVSLDETKSDTVSKRLKRCSEPKRFVALLAIEDAQKYAQMIDEIEQRIRRGERIDLAAYKKRL